MGPARGAVQVTGRHAGQGPQSWLTPAARRWAYGVALAVIALCTAYGLIDDNAAALWGNLAAAVLALAITNTPTEGGTSGRDDTGGAQPGTGQD